MHREASEYLQKPAAVSTKYPGFPGKNKKKTGYCVLGRLVVDMGVVALRQGTALV